MNDPTRRGFLGTAAVAAASLAGCAGRPGGDGPDCAASTRPPSDLPAHLTGYEAPYREDPRAAALRWFRDARYGLFVHYCLASLLPGGKQELKADGTDAKGLFARFAAERFDADAIADLALEAGMRYVT